MLAVSAFLVSVILKLQLGDKNNITTKLELLVPSTGVIVKLLYIILVVLSFQRSHEKVSTFYRPNINNQ